MYFQIYIITLSVIVGFCSGLTGKDLNIRLYEVDERNSVRKVLETNPNSDVILDGINRIRLECNAPFPVQWIYTGNGVRFIPFALHITSLIWIFNFIGRTFVGSDPCVNHTEREGSEIHGVCFYNFLKGVT